MITVRHTSLIFCLSTKKQPTNQKHVIFGDISCGKMASTAEDCKAKGNEALKAQDFEAAIRHYSDAINLDSSNHIYFSNRSAAYLSKGDGENALLDADKCVTIKPDWAKSYSRKGAALHQLSRLQEALEVYKLGLEACPNDSSLESALKSVQSLLSSSSQALPAKQEGSSPDTSNSAPQPVPEWKTQSEEYVN
jgi:tetratricopeptide (TPR) repeat protein